MQKECQCIDFNDVLTCISTINTHLIVFPNENYRGEYIHFGLRCGPQINITESKK